MSQKRRRQEPADILEGTLHIFGIKLDLGELVASPESLKARLDELREKLKAAGARETLSDEDWRRGGISVAGHIRTRGILGDQEFHIGTMGAPPGGTKPGPATNDVVEPPVDVFDEGEQITIIADIPGVSVEDLTVKVEGNLFTLSTRAEARRRYQKELRLGAAVNPQAMRVTCRNGVLEVRLTKLGKVEGGADS